MNILCSLCWIVITAHAHAATVVMTPPIPYRSILDSPYYDQHLSPSEEDQPSNAYYEDFEELFDGLGGVLVLGPGGERVRTPNPSGGGANYSVDGDDGNLGGVATTGHGWAAAGTAANYPLRAFDFLPRATTGHYPVWFGFAVTNANPPRANFPTLMQIIGVDNSILASVNLMSLEQQIVDIPIGPSNNGVLNDIFVSWQSSAPIKRVTITNGNGFVIDHFQWGYTIPEPGTAVLLLAGAAFALRRRRVVGRR